ncbi:MAG: phytase [Acidobacteriota bacterium]
MSKLLHRLLLLALIPAPVGAEIVKGPYLQNVKTDGITIMWESDRPTVGIVQYGRTPGYGATAEEEEPRRIHEIVLTGLEVETLYHYQVLSGSDASPDRTFRTAVRADSPFHFVYYGDNKNGPHMHRTNAARISSEDPYLVLQCGDLVNRGDVYSQWERLFFTPARDLIDHVPIYPTLGNHERNAEHYFEYFSLPGEASGTESWYSFDYGNVHFVILNSNPNFMKEGSEQLDWLVQDLQGSRASWKFVSFHHPPFTAGGNYYTSRRLELKRLLHPIFERHGVDIVFNGHDHNYERSRPIASREGRRPVTYIVNGNGGTPMRYIGEREWTVISERVFGYTLVKMDGLRLELEAKTVDGRVIDDWVLDKGDPESDREYLAGVLAYESIHDPGEAIRLFEEGEDLVDLAEELDEMLAGGHHPREVASSLGLEFDPGEVGPPGERALFQAALEKFQKAFELDPTFVEALVEAGIMNLELGNEELAIAQFRQAIEIKPVYPDSYDELIGVYLEGGKREEAMRLARQWAQVEPDQADPMEAVAEIYLEQGRMEEAVVAYQRALQRVPSAWEIHVDLAALYENMGLAEQAETHLREAQKWIDAEETELLQSIRRRLERLRPAALRDLTKAEQDEPLPDAHALDSQARLATQPVGVDADDPALWIDPDDPSRSLVLGTDKAEAPGGSLFVFGLDGKIRQKVGPLDRPNNVDVEYGLLLDGKLADIAVVTERMRSRLRVFRVPPDGGELTDVSSEGGLKVFEGQPADWATPMGIALYRRPRDGAVFAIVGRKYGPREGHLWQYRLQDDGGGRVQAVKVREFGRYSGTKEIEAIAVDDALGYVYYADERHGIHKWHADPDHPEADRELALFGTEGFAGDREGIAIYSLRDGTGYIVCTDQRSERSEYRIYRREGTPGNPHDHSEVLKVVRGNADSTDGIEVTSTPLGPEFPSACWWP